MGWSRLEESKSADTGSNSTKSCRKNPLGRPRICWKDVVKKDVEQLIGYSNWRNLAMDRERWKLVCDILIIKRTLKLTSFLK